MACACVTLVNSLPRNGMETKGQARHLFRMSMKTLDLPNGANWQHEEVEDQ
jgi:hypothetical protein